MNLSQLWETVDKGVWCTAIMGSQRLGHDLATEKQQQNWKRANKQFSLFKMQQKQHGGNVSRLLIRTELEMHTMQMGRECWAEGVTWRWAQDVWQPDPAQSHRQLASTSWRREPQSRLFISILSKWSQRALAAWAANWAKSSPVGDYNSTPLIYAGFPCEPTPEPKWHPGPFTAVILADFPGKESPEANLILWRLAWMKGKAEWNKGGNKSKAVTKMATASPWLWVIGNHSVTGKTAGVAGGRQFLCQFLSVSFFCKADLKLHEFCYFLGCVTPPPPPPTQVPAGSYWAGRAAAPKPAHHILGRQTASWETR